jgi:hypothetical protein
MKHRRSSLGSASSTVQAAGGGARRTTAGASEWRASEPFKLLTRDAARRIAANIQLLDAVLNAGPLEARSPAHQPSRARSLGVHLRPDNAASG